MSKLLKRSLVLAIVLVAVFAIGAVAGAAGATDPDFDYEVETAALETGDSYAITKGNSKTPTTWIETYGDDPVIDISKKIPAKQATDTKDKTFIWVKTDGVADPSVTEIKGRAAVTKDDIVFNPETKSIGIGTASSVAAFDYKIGDQAWVLDVTELDLSAATKAVKVSVRVTAVDGAAYASAIISISVPVTKAPVVTYDYKTDTVKGLKVGYAATTIDPSGSDISTVIADAEELATLLADSKADSAADVTLYVQVPVKGKAPSSPIVEVLIPKQSAAPSGITDAKFYDNKGKTDFKKVELTGGVVVAGLQYKKVADNPATTTKDETVWANVPATGVITFSTALTASDKVFLRTPGYAPTNAAKDNGKAVSAIQEIGSINDPN
ncbi:MAG: hypothetical protein LBN00_10420 [Oscillospiraceae bacterium]|nr:hypothetical protein [Oscillospiraceae bacterium]